MRPIEEEALTRIGEIDPVSSDHLPIVELWTDDQQSENQHNQKVFPVAAQVLELLDPGAGSVEEGSDGHQEQRGSGQA